MNKPTVPIIILAALITGAAFMYFVYPYMTNNTNSLAAQNGDKVYVHYTGKLENGTKFDSSVDRGSPFSFVLGQGMVIKGWDEGLVGMKVGEKKVLTIAPEKGYGAQGVPDQMGGYIIPPNSTLIFDVEMIDIQRP